MKKNIISVLSILLVCHFNLRAQTLSPTVAAQGGTDRVGNTVISYTFGQPLGETLIGGANIITMGYEQPEQNIVINSLTDTPFYSGGWISAHFTAKGVYGPGNVFILQLSDSTGSFGSPLNIGTDTGMSSGVIMDSIPFNITGSANYQARIVSTYPPFIGGPFSPVRIHTIGVPIGLRSETACSDSSYTFTFSGITAGNGGNQIEWAYNKSFVGSTIVNSPANLAFTISANSIDTIWARSRDSIDATHIFVSNLVTVTERVDTLPNATVYPGDAALLQGDTLLLQANGGVSYYWPELGIDSSVARIVFSGDSMNYVVNVTGGNGCVKEERERLYASALATLSSVLLLTDPDDTSVSINITNNSDTSIYGCHDYLTLGEVLEPQFEGSFTILQIFPSFITPDTTTLADSSSIYGRQSVSSTGTGITCSLHPGIYSDTLFWQIPAAYGAGNIKLITRMYTNCKDADSRNLLTSQPVVSRLLVPGSNVTQDSSATYLPNIYFSAVRFGVTSIQASANEEVSQTIDICSGGPTMGVYAVEITPSIPIDSVKLQGAVGSISLYGSFSPTNPIVISEANLQTIQGVVPLLTTGPDAGCISVSISLIAPDTCSTEYESYNVGPVCNASAPAPFAVNCGGLTQTAHLSVGDNGNNDPIRVTSAFFQNGTRDTSINLCDTSFSILYTLFNKQHLTGVDSTNTKHLQSFTVFMNPNWINAGSLSVTYYTAGGTPHTVGYTDSSGVIVIGLSGLGLTLYNDSTGYISLSGLKINYGGFTSCVAPDTVLLSSGTIAYLSNCGSASYLPLPPYTASSATSYSNVVGVTAESGVTFDGHFNNMVAPGEEPSLNYSWGQYPENGNPWYFGSSVTDSAAFFQCPTVIYQAVLDIPNQVALVNTDNIIYRNGNGINQNLAITQDSDGLWYATLPEFGNSDTISYQVKLNLAFCATDSVPIPPVPVTLSLTAICEDGTCSTRYCMKTITNLVSVHCPGVCDGTGIGTSQFIITNLNAPGVNAGYACDVIDFKVTGQGFHGTFPAPTPENTASIFLVLTYPDSLGTADSIFSLTNATVSASYIDSGITHTIPISMSGVTRTLDSGQWTIIVPITDTIVRTIRNQDDTFIIDLQMPIECNLGYDTLNNGVCSLGGITALMEFSSLDSGILFSCDNATSSFELIAHKYGTATSIIPNGACGQTLVIMDSVIDGLPRIPEMPGYQRPLIQWPTDGSFTITYPLTMSIQSITYSDSTDSIYPPTLVYSTLPFGTEQQTKIYGFDSASQYYWPAYSKDGPEFFRKLVIQFSQTGCGNEVVNDTLPHQLQDGKTAAQCTTSCDSFIRFTDHDTSMHSPPEVYLTETTTGSSAGYNPGGGPTPQTTFIVPMVIHSAGGVNPNSIYIAPSITNPIYPIIPPPVITLVGSGANIPLHNNSGSTIYTRITSDSIQLKVTVSANSCVGMHITVPIGYSCSESDSTSLCYIDSDFAINFEPSSPYIQSPLIFTPANNNFSDCKGTCCSDLLERSFTIFNTEDYGGGFAYNPVLSLTDIGPGYLDISKVVFTYNTNPTQVTISMPDTTYTNIASFNLSDTIFALLGLSSDSNGNSYLNRLDSLKVDVYVYGDGKNCASKADLQAVLTYKSICGIAEPAAFGTTTFTFNTGQCDTPVCTGTSVCADFDPFTSCSPCDYGAPISIYDSIINPGCGVNSTSGRIWLYVVGGPPNGSGYLPVYTYSWNNGATDSVIQGLTAGTYVVTVNDDGCIDTASFTLTNSGLIVYPFVTNMRCYNGHDGSISLSVSGGTGNYSYRWGNASGILDSTGNSISNLNIGAYFVTVTSRGDTMNGCVPTFADTFTITQPQLMSVNISTVPATCGGTGSATISSIVHGAPNYKFLWSNDDSTLALTSAVPGNYTVTITDANGCTVSDTVNITTPLAAVSITDTNVTCYGMNNGMATAAYTVDTGYISYHWNNGDTTAHISGLAPGTYSVTATNSVGCSASVSATITQPALLSASITGSDSICANEHTGNVHVTASGGTSPYHYTWSISDTTQNIDSLATGTYYVTVTDNLGCNVKDSLIIHTATFVISISETNLTCYGIRNGTATVTALDTEGTISYLWSTGRANATITGLDTGSYSVTVTNSMGCSATASIYIHQPSPFSVLPHDTNPSCGANGAIGASVSGATPPYSYLWNVAGPGNTQSFVAGLPADTGGTTYVLFITDSLGCKDTLRSTLYGHLPLSGDWISKNVACYGGDTGSINLSGSIYGGVHPYTYQWSTGATTQSITGLTAGTYSVILTDSVGCTYKDTITVSQPVVLSAGDTHTDSICKPGTGSITVNPTGGTSPYNYNWSNGDNTQSITGINRGTYTVTITDVHSCSVSLSVTIDSSTSHFCCFSNPDTTIMVINQDTLSSEITIPNGSFVYVARNVTLTVDNNLTLQQCEFVMGGNSMIDVISGDTLKVLGSYLHSCDTMWFGIVLDDTSSLVVSPYDGDTTIIEGALYGVFVNATVNKMLITSTKFYRDAEGIYFNTYNPAHSTDYQVANCYFGLGAYSNLLPVPSVFMFPAISHPFFGIVMNQNEALQIPNISRTDAHYNTFENMNAGINAQGPVSIYSNYFKNIHNYDTSFSSNYFSSFGSAIYLRGIGSTQLVQANTTRPGAGTAANFINCDYGIQEQTAAFVSAYNNRMDSVTNGIFVNGNLAGKINVGNNYITHTNYGISFINNSSSTQYADTNVIYVNPPTNQYVIAYRIVHFWGGIIYFPYDSAILTNTYGIMQTDAYSSTTNILSDTVYGGRNCIYVSTARNTQIKNNFLYQNDHTVVGGVQSGLYAANCTGLYIIDNYCYGDSSYYAGTPNSATSATNTSSRRKSGMSFYNCSATCDACDNVFGGTAANTGIGYGMQFSSYCDHFTVINNQFNQNYFAMTLQSSGIASVLGDQGLTGASQENSFTGSGGGSFSGGNRTASYINFSSADSAYIPPRFYYDSIYSTTNPAPGYALLNGGSNPSEAIRGRAIIPDVGAAYDLCNLYYPLPLHITNNIFAYNIVNNTRMDTVVAQGNTATYFEPGFDSTMAWLPQKMVYEELYYDTALLDTNTVMSTFISNMSNSDVAAIFQNEIQNIALTDSANMVDSITYNKVLESAQSAAQSLPDSNIRAANYKAMSNIYLNTIASGVNTFTSGQLDTIANLAIQCPYNAGDAVYIARSLYAQYDNTIFFDDLAICTPVPVDSDRMLIVLRPNNVQDTTQQTIVTPDYILVYPNPAKNVLKIFYSSANNASMIFELTDLAGQKITSTTVANLSMSEIDVSRIADGLYLWKGRNGNVPIQTGKVSIQK